MRKPRHADLPPGPRNVRNGDVPQRYDVGLVPTTDDWYPNHPDNTVRISALELVGDDGTIDMTRVCVWGADDCGMEIDFPIEKVNFMMAVIIADNLPKPIKKDDLTLLGFKPA